MNRLILILSFMLSVVSLSAQQKEIVITGSLIEEGGMPVSYATVVAVDSVSKSPLSGTTSDDEGAFNFTAKGKAFYIEISFIGFITKKITDFNIKNNKVNLGRVTLNKDIAQLNEVVVEADRSQTVFKLDRREFHVGSDLSSSGASALEVLNNVPSVNVSIEGAISLRGSEGVQILINGKPSVLTSDDGNALGSITADMIEKVEVITNPSAKYDASGTTGIINIVLKKSEKRGLNGSISLNTGVPDNHSIGLSMNKRTEKFNFFGQVGYGMRNYPRDSKVRSLNREQGSLLTNEGESWKKEDFYNLILGTDYHINDLNVISLSGRYAYEIEDETSDQEYQFIDQFDVLEDQWTREETTSATNPKWEFDLQYKKDFKDNKDRNLTFSALGSSFGKDKESDFTNTVIIGDTENSLQEAETDFAQYKYTFKLDYTHPFAEHYTIEVGTQYLLDDVSNDYQVRDFIDNEWVENSEFSNVFDYDQGVLGGYTTLAYEGDKWGVKGGLRVEDTDLKTLLVNTNGSNSQQYTNLFPSAHTSYKFSKKISLQAGYSRRIFRPSLWNLNPFVSFRDNFNLRTGNPNLLPEFTDSYEITSIYKYEQGSINLGAYYRATEDVIERITTFSDNVTISSPENIGRKDAIGVELNADYSPTKNVRFTADFNYSYFERKGEYENQNFDFTGSQWDSKLIGKFKLPSDFTVEITGNYRSDYETIQGRVAENLFMNFGIRKRMMKGRLNMNLGVRDVFASRIRKTITDQSDFYSVAESQRGRFITFGISFGFGKGEAMVFTGRRR